MTDANLLKHLAIIEKTQENMSDKLSHLEKEISRNSAENKQLHLLFVEKVAEYCARISALEERARDTPAWVKRFEGLEQARAENTEGNRFWIGTIVLISLAAMGIIVDTVRSLFTG